MRVGARGWIAWALLATGVGAACHQAPPSPAALAQDAAADTVATPLDAAVDQAAAQDTAVVAEDSAPEAPSVQDATVPEADAPQCNLLRPAVDWPVPVGAKWIIAGDLDGDGHQDLALTTTQLTVLLGNGDGTFRAATSYLAGNGTSCLAAADLDGDGKLDIVVASGGDGQKDPGAVEVFRNKGDGTFQPAVTFPTPGSCFYGVTIGDFNADGKPDIAVSAEDGGCQGGAQLGEVDVLLGNGDGTFQPGVSYASAIAGNQGEIASADLNGDQKVDLVVADSRGLDVLLGKGDGTFMSPASYGKPALALLAKDVNLDGISDLVSATYVVIGAGDGTFGPPITLPTWGQFNSVGDVSGDGKPDIIQPGAVLLGRGDGTFQAGLAQAVGQTPFSTSIADFDEDGRADVAVANFSSGNLSVLLGCP